MTSTATMAITRALFPSAKGKVYLPADIVKRVAEGAEFLDNTTPDWFNILDLDRLDLKNGCYCVMGQIVTSVPNTPASCYFDAVGYETIGGGDSLPSRVLDPLVAIAMTHNEAVERGFHVTFAAEANQWGNVEWEQLTVAWRRVIKRRRINANKRAAILADWMKHFPNN